METPSPPPHDDWSWLDQFLMPDCLIGIPEAQPQVPTDPSDGGGASADSAAANNASGVISAAPLGSHPINHAPPEGIGRPTGSLFNQPPPEYFDLFVTSDSNRFPDAHPENTRLFASDSPLYGVAPMELYGTAAVG